VERLRSDQLLSPIRYDQKSRVEIVTAVLTESAVLLCERVDQHQERGVSHSSNWSRILEEPESEKHLLSYAQGAEGR
jgi:hypothetical protein